MQFPENLGRAQIGMMIVLASGLLYAASRAAVFALSRPDGSDPGRRAIGQWLPIAATVLMAVVLHRADVAVALVFGTSVACLSLVLGLATYVTPMQTLPQSRRAWPFVLPAALLVLMAGFSSNLTWWHALMLLALGGAIVPVWRQSPEPHDASSKDPLPPGPAALTLIFALALMGLGAYLAVKGTVACSQTTRIISSGTIAATILSPLLVLPTLGAVSAVAQRGDAGRAVGALVGTVLLNLCALLPMAILLWYPASDHWRLRSFRDFRAPWESLHALPYAAATWRIETVLLVVLGLFLAPIAMGRWTLGRGESILLMVGYAAYILLLTVFGVQMI